MFRRFGIFAADEVTEYEMLLNLNHIIGIAAINDGRTRITLLTGVVLYSAIEYKHLADALDGVR